MIPIQLNPLGVQENEYFTITVTPGFKKSGSAALGMTYQLQLRGPKGAAYYINWGDGTVDQSTIAATDTRQTHSHTYTIAGTYTVKLASERVDLIIVGQLYQSYDYAAPYASLVKDCNFNWKALPGITKQLFYSFSYCRNATYEIPNLPSTLTSASGVFYQNQNANVAITQLPNLQYSDRLFYNAGLYTDTKFTLKKLPDNLGKGNGDVSYMFSYTNLVANLNQFVSNAPSLGGVERGWGYVKNVSYMFAACSGLTGSRSVFANAVPNVTTGDNTAFTLANNTTD